MIPMMTTSPRHLFDEIARYAAALGITVREAKKRIKAQEARMHGYAYGERIRRPNINHCRDCERAYETGMHAPAGHPWNYDPE
jgi:hypothetical protein